MRAKGLVLKLAKTQTYRLTPRGFRICDLFLKLFHRCTPHSPRPFSRPIADDAILPDERRSGLDTLYAGVDRALDLLLADLGLKLAETIAHPYTTYATKNAYLCHVLSPITGLGAKFDH